MSIGVAGVIVAGAINLLLIGVLFWLGRTQAAPKLGGSMRAVTDHKVGEGSADVLDVYALDEPGAGGASHRYGVSDGTEYPITFVYFQDGPIKDVGVNGVTQEALLAIVVDRLRSFQAGPFKCRENAIALTHCEDALLWLHKRTRDRIARGVEGQSKA